MDVQRPPRVRLAAQVVGVFLCMVGWLFAAVGPFYALGLGIVAQVAGGRVWLSLLVAVLVLAIQGGGAWLLLWFARGIIRQRRAPMVVAGVLLLLLSATLFAAARGHKAQLAMRIPQAILAAAGGLVVLAASRMKVVPDERSAQVLDRTA